MSDRSDKESSGKTKGNLERLTQELIKRGFKRRPTPKGVRIRIFENPKVPLKPKTSEKDSTKDEN